MINEIKNYLDKEFNGLEEKLVGGVVNVVYQGEVMYERYIGLANYEHKISICKDTVFPISSLTKQFTAMVIMIMQEEGLINYTDKVNKYLKDFPSYAQELTIKDLLHQMTGLIDPYSYYEDNNLDSYNINNTIIYRLLQDDKKIKFPVGEKFEYCNSNYVLLAMIAETIYNISFRDILKEKIFTPLKMRNSDLYDSRYIINNRAYGYINENGMMCTVDNQWLSYGDGGIISTVKDLVLWDQALYEEKLVTKENLQLAYTSGKTNEGKDTRYGFGWVINKKGENKIVRHAGGDTGFGSMISRIPEKKFSIILLSNIDNSWNELAQIANDVENILLKY